MKKFIILYTLFYSVNILAQEKVTPEFFKANNGSTNRSGKFTNAKLDDYDVVFYGLNIEATNTTALISAGDVIIKAKVVNGPLSLFVIQLKNNMSVSEIKINNQITSSYTHTNDEISITFPTPIPAGDLFTAEIKYSGTPQGGGWQNTPTGWGGRVTWTLSESFHAYEWFPVKQVLADKADSADIFITVPTGIEGVSNGLLKNVVNLNNGKTRFEWKSRYPIDYYLLAVTISDYQEYDTHPNITGLAAPLLIQNFVYNASGCLNQYKAAIDETGAIVELFSNLFGLYPFSNEKYGHVMAPIGGGMEHQTITTASTLENWLIAHELAHMWFGDYVTCGTWQDIWINEGFASYGEYLNLQYLSSQSDATLWMLAAQNSAKSLPQGSVYLSADESTDENRIFSSQLSYDKGAAIIHILRYEINNDKIFFNIIKKFLSRYGHKTATGADFKSVVNELTGSDYSWFFNQWYYGYGYPTFSFQYGLNSENKPWITVSQTPSSSETPLFTTSMDLKLTFDDNSTSTQRVFISENPQTFTFDLPQIKSIQADPDRWLIMDIGSITSDEILNNNISISVGPNPFKDKIRVNLTSNYGNCKVAIIDISGKTLFNSVYNQKSFELNTESLPKGIYIIQVYNEKEFLSKKVVKTSDL